jgi:hypothetical protein
MSRIYNKITSLKIVTATIVGILTLTNAAEAYEPHEHPWINLPASTFWRKLDTQQEGDRYCQKEFYDRLYTVTNNITAGIGGTRPVYSPGVNSILITTKDNVILMGPDGANRVFHVWAHMQNRECVLNIR